MPADSKIRICLDCGVRSRNVDLTTTPDRSDFKMFPRCPTCYERRYRIAKRTMKRYPESFIGPCPIDNPEW